MGIQAPAFRELRFDRLGRSFGAAQALTDVDFTIRKGEFVALLGPSGCGKSTTLNILAGLLPATSGGIFLDSTRIDTLRPEERGFGMVFQNYALFPAHERAQEHRLRPRHAPPAESGDRPEGRRGDRHGAARRPGGQAARPALGRPAAARRHRARDRRRTASGADGRAAVEPRRQAEARDARRDSPHPQRARRDDDLRHA